MTEEGVGTETQSGAGPETPAGTGPESASGPMGASGAETDPGGVRRRASPWPLLVAGGLAVSEVGVLFGVPAVAVAGLLVFVGSVAGVVAEAGYAASPWLPAAALGVVLLAAGATLVAAGGVTVRGTSVAAAGAVAVAAAAAGRTWSEWAS